MKAMRLKSLLLYIMNIVIAIGTASTAVCCDCIHCLNESGLDSHSYGYCLFN